MGKKVKAVLRLDVPFSSDPPQLTSEAVGLPRIVRRVAHSFVMDSTILDSADARLQRAGVTLAHRVSDGIGEWFLSAPAWVPHLPEELVEPVDAAGDLPGQIGRVIRPILRRGVLGTLAAVHLERTEWSLRDAEGGEAAVVRDDRVTISRSGIITARYREIEITPITDLTGQQRDFLLSAGLAAGATVVDRFPTLRHRIGAPASGLTGFPKPREVGRDATLEEFVTAVFARHLAAVVRADLDRRGAGGDDLGELDDRLWAFGRDLRGLASVLEPSWREQTERLLAGLPFESAADADAPVLDIIDALIGAVRAPRLGDLSQLPAARVLFDKAEQATLILADRCRHLDTTSGDDAWAAALKAAEQLEVVLAVAAPVMPKEHSKMSRRLADVIASLRSAVRGSFVGDPELDGLSVQQAYQLGRETERKRLGVAAVRQDFVDGWPKVFKEARKLVEKARKRERVR